MPPNFVCKMIKQINCIAYSHRMGRARVFTCKVSKKFFVYEGYSMTFRRHASNGRLDHDHDHFFGHGNDLLCLLTA